MRPPLYPAVRHARRRSFTGFGKSAQLIGLSCQRLVEVLEKILLILDTYG